MVKKKYADDQAVMHKIRALFEYRKITELLHLSHLHKNKEWVAHLYHIQYQIYLLDAYLESHWQLDKAELKKFWQGIHASLQEIGYTKPQRNHLLREIRQYERIEKNCRKDKWPTRISYKAFYTTKSCDVRLMRHLIYAAAPQLKEIWKEEVWKYYDLITEINDDISDLKEDVSTYNGNRYLISILRKGIGKTNHRYKRHIRKITQKADRFFKAHPKQERDHLLHDWILLRSKETTALLEQPADPIDTDHLASALLLAYMK